MRKNQNGFVLIAMSVVLLLMLALVGIAFDFGRIYIARNEAQVFTDAAALAAVKKLDGTLTGVRAAREAVAQLPNRWNLGTQTFNKVRVEFSEDERRWMEDPKDPTQLAYARVVTPANEVDITILRAVGGPEKFAVAATSEAALRPLRLVE